MKNRKDIKYFIIDFDSTFVQSEGLEELAEVILRNRSDSDLIIKKIKEITNSGMEGKIRYDESLKRRLKLLQGNRLHINQVVKILRKKISKSILRNKSFFKKYSNYIYIISGGFKEFIFPIVKSFGIEKSHIFANNFLLDKQGKIVGLNFANPLAKENGKVNVVKNLALKGEVIVIGDGYTDFQIRSMGVAKHFVAFTENIYRESVVNKADKVATNFDEFLFINKLPRSLSYPKNRIKAVLLNKIAANLVNLFKKEGYQVEKEKKYLVESHLIIAKNSREVAIKDLINAKYLLAVGFLNQDQKLNSEFFTERGIAVFLGKDAIKKIIDYVNLGKTVGSVNLPEVLARKSTNSHRLLHLHKNVPGILAKINTVMADYNINILRQNLNTNEQIGYVITDVDKKYDEKVIKELKKIPDTIRFRVLY